MCGANGRPERRRRRAPGEPLRAQKVLKLQRAPGAARACSRSCDSGAPARRSRGPGPAPGCRCCSPAGCSLHGWLPAWLQVIAGRCTSWENGGQPAGGSCCAASRRPRRGHSVAAPNLACIAPRAADPSTGDCWLLFADTLSRERGDTRQLADCSLSAQPSQPCPDRQVNEAMQLTVDVAAQAVYMPAAQSCHRCRRRRRGQGDGLRLSSAPLPHPSLHLPPHAAPISELQHGGRRPGPSGGRRHCDRCPQGAAHCGPAREGAPHQCHRRDVGGRAHRPAAGGRATPAAARPPSARIDQGALALGKPGRGCMRRSCMHPRCAASAACCLLVVAGLSIPCLSCICSSRYMQA